MNCEFCDKPAVGYVSPPLCEQHFDLAVLASKLVSQGRHVTRENMKALFRKGQANGGVWEITEEDIERLMAGPFAVEYRVREVEGV